MIWKNNCSLGHHRLLFVIFTHHAVCFGEICFYCVKRLLMQFHFSAKKLGNRLFRQVVLCRPKPSAYHNYIGAQKPFAHAIFKSAWIIAHNRMMINANSEICQLCRQKSGVCINYVTKQKLLARAKNFGYQFSFVHNFPSKKQNNCLHL